MAKLAGRVQPPATASSNTAVKSLAYSNMTFT